MYDQLVALCKRVRQKLDVHHTEATFKRAIAAELIKAGIAFTQEAPHLVMYDGQPMAWNRTDFIVDDALVLEVKAVVSLREAHRQQAVRYGQTLKKPVLLVNFKAPSATRNLEIQCFD